MKTTLFCAGFFWSSEVMAIRSSWDTVIAHMLTLISGLGLCMMFVMWTLQAYGKKAVQESLPIKQTKNCANKCG